MALKILIITSKSDNNKELWSNNLRSCEQAPWEKRAKINQRGERAERRLGKRTGKASPPPVPTPPRLFTRFRPLLSSLFLPFTRSFPDQRACSQATVYVTFWLKPITADHSPPPPKKKIIIIKRGALRRNRNRRKTCPFITKGSISCFTPFSLKRIKTDTTPHLSLSHLRGSHAYHTVLQMKGTIHIDVRCFGVYYRRIFSRVVLYFDEPAGLVKIQTTSKNIRQYFTPKHLIRDLLSNLTFFNLFQ